MIYVLSAVLIMIGVATVYICLAVRVYIRSVSPIEKRLDMVEWSIENTIAKKGDVQVPARGSFYHDTVGLKDVVMAMLEERGQIIDIESPCFTPAKVVFKKKETM